VCLQNVDILNNKCNDTNSGINSDDLNSLKYSFNFITVPITDTLNCAEAASFPLLHFKSGEIFNDYFIAYFRVIYSN